jgi:hypothetical protein
VEPDKLWALERWLPHGQVDQKRADAVAMLEIMRGRAAGEIPAMRALFHFEHTSYWERVVRQHADEHRSDR